MRPLVAMLLACGLLLTGCAGEGTVEEDAATDTTVQPDDAAQADGEGGGEASPEPSDGAQAEPTATEDKDDVGLALPTATPEPTGPPTEDLPGGRYVEITGIRAEGGAYAVDFTPYNFEPFIGEGDQDFHVHFFFNDLEPANAGTNGPSPGEWFLYDGPSPFTGYTFADRPPEATQLCALVADARHGVTVGSGNCVTLP